MEYVVSNNSDLTTAIKAASAGDVILLNKSSSAYNLRLDTYNLYANNLTFRSADPNDPAVFESVQLYSVNNITFEDLRFEESTSFGGADVVLHIRDSKNITVRDSVMVGTGTEFLSKNGSEHVANNLTNIKYADGLTFENNLVSNFFFGVTVLESAGVTISGNEFHSMQADPIQVAGVQNTYIENNYIHDLLGSDSNVNHLDMIQLWSTNAESLTQNLYIRNNVLDAGEGLAAQSIFLNNEQYRSSGQKYKNIVITDNVIHNNDPHGITVAQTDGVSIFNNTIVVAEDAFGVANGVVKTHEPMIRVPNGSSNVRVQNNVAPAIEVSGGTSSNNLIVNYDNPLASNHVSNLFVNPLSKDLDIMTDLMDLPGGQLATNSIGSRLLDFDTSPDSPFGLMLNDAGDGLYMNNHGFDLSNLYDQNGRIDTTGATVNWDFGDGQTQTTNSVTASHYFADHGNYNVQATIRLADGRTVVAEKTIEAETPLAIATDFESGVREASPHNMTGTAHGNVQFVNDGGSKVAKLNSGHISYENTEDFFNNREFSVVADFRKDNTSDWGDLFWFSSSFTISIRDNALIASYGTNTGTHWINERYLPIDNTDWHRVVMTFDGNEKTASLYLDGDHIKTIYNIGTSQIGVNDDLYIGSPYGRSFDGLVDNFSFLRGSMSAQEVGALGAAGSGTDAITERYISGEGFEVSVEQVVAVDEQVSEQVEAPTQQPEPEPEPEPAPVAETVSSGSGNVSGRYFVDSNENDFENSSEAGVSNASVALMSGNQVIATTKTDGNGNYSFSGLENGHYYVRFNADSQGRDFIRGNVGGNDAVDSDVWKTDGSGNGVSASFQISGATNITNMDAGVEPTGSGPVSPVAQVEDSPGVAEDRSVSGRVFVDQDNDDRKDNGETGVSGTTISLIKGGNVVATTTTGSNGSYSFSDLEDGHYFLEFAPDASGRAFIRGNVGSNEGVDSDVWKVDGSGNGISASFEISGNTRISNLDAGVEREASLNVPTPEPEAEAPSNSGGKISGRYFLDNDRDNSEDATDSGVSGARIHLVTGGRVVANTTTDANGYYGFSGLAKGHYYVQFEADSSGRDFVRGNVGSNEAVDSDVWRTDGVGNGISSTVEITGSNVITNVDAGIVGSNYVSRASTAPIGEVEEGSQLTPHRLVFDEEAPTQAPDPLPVLATIVEADQISLSGNLAKDKLLFDVANREIRIDSDNDGTVDEIIKLSGEFSNGGFLAVFDGSETVVSFNKFIGSLAEGRSLNAQNINGVENDLYLLGTDAISEFQVSIIAADTSAKYDNSLGVYEYDDAGNITDVRLLAENIKTAPTSFTISEVDAGNKLGFFIIQDGYNRIDTSLLVDSDLAIDTNFGRAILTNDGNMVSGAQVFVSHQGSLNSDGMEHVVSGLASSGNGIQIGFEDQRRDGTTDNDFQDIVLHVEAVELA